MGPPSVHDEAGRLRSSAPSGTRVRMGAPFSLGTSSPDANRGAVYQRPVQASCPEPAKLSRSALPGLLLAARAPRHLQGKTPPDWCLGRPRASATPPGRSCQALALAGSHLL